MKPPMMLFALQILGAILALCLTSPARADDVTDIVITEIQYNPASGNREDDFIELFNQSSTTNYNLQGYSFTAGVTFVFPDVSIGPRAYLVVCANETRVRQQYGITNTVGNWDPLSSLDNGGERIRIINASALEVEDLTFDDRNPWPILADGYGYSLQRRNPAYDNDNPANWSAGVGTLDWTHVTLSGLATSSRLYLYLIEAGTAYLDNVTLYPQGNPGDERITLGGFESASLSPWVATGTHAGSGTSTEEKRTGARSLKIVATGAGSSQPNSVYQDNLGLTNNNPYTLEFDLLLTAVGQTLVARLSGSDVEAEFYIETGGGGATPGRQNAVFATDIPPFIYPGVHSPGAPTASSQVSLLCQVEDDVAIGAVTGHYNSGGADVDVPMFDDGAHGDGAASDGLFAASIGTFPTGSIVRYWFTATDNLGQSGRFPFMGNPTPTLGFYIQPPGINPTFQLRSNSGLTSTKPPVYHLLIDPAFLTGNPPSLTSPSVYVRGTFIYNGEVFDNVRIRHRGQTSLGVPKKHWKVNFNKDHRFRTPFDDHAEVDNINIESSYGDKTFLRDWLSYKAWMDVGLPGLEVWTVRLYLNGAYRGLYNHLENPSSDWLDRTGLDSEGWLWKSYSEAKGGTGGFELKADGGNASAANAALGSFISNMNNLTGQALVDYINANLDVPSFTDFLVLHQLIHNCDHPAKNYLVYADEDAPASTWTYFLWDADLTHGRNYECAGGGVYNDTIRFDMFTDPQFLFGTSARPKCDGPWNGVINGFLNRTTAFRQAYYARLGELVDLLYDPSVLNPIIDDMAANLGGEPEMDWNRNTPYGNRATYAFHVSQLKGYVQNRYNYIKSKLSDLDAPELSDLICARNGDNASLSWTRHGTYSSIKVYLNDTLVRTLGGTANSTSVALDLGQTINTFRVASILAGTERAGDSCTIILSSGGFTKVIDEDFSPAASTALLSVNCGATQANGGLQLTDAVGSQAGAAFFKPQYPDGDFIADFDFRMDDPSSPGADGMVFIVNLSNDPSYCGNSGGALGYFTDDLNNNAGVRSFAVVFDTWQNGSEPSHNWVGLYDSRGGGSTRLEAVDVPEEMTGNGTFHATVFGEGGLITLVLSNSSIGMAPREIFSRQLPGFGEEPAFFGFSAGTGGAVARHIVDNFVLQINTGVASPTAAFIGAPLTGDAPLQVAFTNQSTGATSYQWDFGDGLGSTTTSPSHTYTTPGTYTVSLTATGDAGDDTEVKTGYITVTSDVVASFVASPTTGKAPLTVSFTSQSVLATSYEWDFGDGLGSTQESPSHTYTQGGEFTVSLTARGAGGAEDTMTRTKLIQVDGPIVAEFSALERSGEAPFTATFVDLSAGSTIQSWLWDFGDGSTSQEPSPSHTYTMDGVYTVQLQVLGFASLDTERKLSYIRVGAPLDGAFIRGDSNSDAKVDISDSISILNYLFAGTFSPDCLDALDADDNGAVDLTDAVRLLLYLFQGGSAPPLPFPDTGEDPTTDSLDPCGR